MKKTVLPAAFALILALQTASAQSSQSVKNSQTLEYVLTAQSDASAKQHASILDKIQQETEELMLTIAPAPFISLAHLIDKKLYAHKEKKAKSKDKAKKDKLTCEL